MRRHNSNPEQHQPREAISSKQQIQHFSHPHALLLTNKPQYPNISCFACESTLSGSTYSCLQCNYFLHLSCSQYPRKIKHPFDINGHTLHLLSVPPYPEGTFKCDACGKQGTGFCYNCAQCGIDLHPTCASMPLLVTHGSHFHQLDLTFTPPYHNKSFSCDLCRMVGSNHWLYRCQSCEFDAHLDCAMGKVIKAYQQPSVPPQGNYGVPYQQPTVPSQGNYGVKYQQPRPLGNNGPARNNSGQGRQSGGILNAGIQGFVNDASQAIGQNVMMGLLGGDGAGGGGDLYGGGPCDSGYTEMSDPGIQDSADYEYGGGFGGGSGSGYYDVSYAEMTDLQTMNMADSADTMNSI